MQITNNSPSAGYIAWTGVTLTYRAVTYSIADGNSNKLFIWWDFSAPTVLQESDTMPTLEDTDFLIFLNDSGTYTLVGIRSRQVHGGIILDGTIPDAALESIYVKTTTAQDIGGVKTFTDFPILPSDNPTLDTEVAHKKYVDDSIGTLDAEDVEIEEIGVATYDDVQNWLNNTQSSGYIIGAEITAVEPADGNVNLAALKGFIKTTDDEIGVTKSFDLAKVDDFVLAGEGTNYIYVDYDGGTPVYAVTQTRPDIKTTWMFTTGRVFKDGNDVHIIQSGIQLPNFLRESHERLLAVRGFERASGGTVTENGNRFLESTSGVFYLGNNHATTPGVNTNNGATFKRHYHAAGPVWTSDTKSQIAEGGAGFYKYDDGVSLQNISNNAYGVFWVFIHFDGDLHVVVGRGSYTLAEAQAATVPAIPNEINDFATLAAKIILLEDGTNFTSIETAYHVFFPLSPAVNHSDLGNLNADDHTQYVLRNILTDTGDMFILASDGDIVKLVLGDNTDVLTVNTAKDPPVEWGTAGAPGAHHETHESGGADAIKLDDLAATEDNTDLDASNAKHGLMKKFTDEAHKWFDASGNFTTPKILGQLFFTVPGELVAGTNVTLELFPTTDLTLTEVFISVKVAPTDANIIVDVNKNGTTIFTTQGGRPEIVATETSDTSDTPDVTALAKNDKLTLDIDQIGSTLPGEDLTVCLRFEQEVS